MSSRVDGAQRTDAGQAPTGRVHVDIIVGRDFGSQCRTALSRRLGVRPSVDQPADVPAISQRSVGTPAAIDPSRPQSAGHRLAQPMGRPGHG